MSGISAGTGSSARLLTPEEIAVRAGQTMPFLRLPQPQLFAEREMRLRQLAAGHAMRDYLLFIAELAHGQHRLLQQSRRLTLVPDIAQIEAAANSGQPLLPAGNWPRDPQWRDDLRLLLQGLAQRVGAGAARETALRLAADSDEHLEAQAERLLSGVMLGLDLGTAPLIAAGLQLLWTRLVLQVQAEHGRDSLAPFGRTDEPTLCPCCGSRPTASITRLGAEVSGYRYLHCALCATEWHFVRIKCSHCQGTKGIQYQSLQALGAEQAIAAAVQAEYCEPCGHYLKIVHMEKDNEVEPLADDLASLTLDLLVSDAGAIRHGVNLMLLFGDPEPEEPSGSAPPPDPGPP
ncbi:MAG: formate dehydrogenase accessory protein FdhE [Burkholderiaceae bacterium]